MLPSLLDYQASKGKTPAALAFSLAALIAFYRGTAVTTNELQGHRGSRSLPRVPLALLRLTLPRAERVELIRDLAGEFHARAATNGARAAVAEAIKG